MAKMMADQGVNPFERIDLLESWLGVVQEEEQLQDEWGDANLGTKFALGRRLGALLNQKLKLRTLLFKRTRGGG
jgi:hypothetical protein